MYKNLEAEIVRHNISKNDIAKVIGKNYITLTLKLRGKSSFLYEEAVKIQETFFPEYDLKELFAVDNATEYDLKELFAVDNANNHEAKTG